jgi:tetratricopeptide (TPR) repeat protein
MLVPLATALVLSMACQSPAADRSLAEQLARSGRTVEALDLFEQILAGNPADLEARLWIARLQLRIGRTLEAEAGFRSVLLEHPSDIDAHIGLAAALTRTHATKEALAMLREVEQDAGANADLFAAFARAYRRDGDDRRALDYYTRARALAPTDPDLVDGVEATVRTYGHSIAFEGFGERGASEVRSGSLAATVRILPRFRVEGRARVQRRDGSNDAVGGGGAVWRVHGSTNLSVHGVGGSGNTSLPTADITAAVVHYAGVFEIGAAIRRLSFADVGVRAASPLLAWDTERWRLDARYTYSLSSFDATGESSGDHSVLLRETWRRWRRVGVNVAYAYGIEGFENLTADRLGSLGTTTIATGLQLRVPSLTSVATTWEHQWRSDDTQLDRVTLSIVQSFP